MKIKLGESVVKVIWEDAWSETGYYSLKSIDQEPPYLTTSVGIAIRANKSGITIAREKFDSDGRFRSVQHIPRGMIKKVRVLK